ncbi:MAG: hypothetical protein JWQ74_1013 [Marmoricola sp.]|nr:hypothetical protein [Marmoricola sp.]
MGPQGAPGRDGGPDRVASWRVTYPGGNVPYVLHLSSQSIPKGTEIEFTSLKVSGDYSSFCVGGRSTVSVGGPFIVNGASWNPKFTTLSPNLGSPQVVPEPVQLNLNVSCNDVDNRRIDVPAYTIDVSFALTDMSMPATETFD